jgi:hypothetical protein
MVFQAYERGWALTGDFKEKIPHKQNNREGGKEIGRLPFLDGPDEC